MNLSLLVTLCNKRFQRGKKRACEVLLWHFLIKTVIAKNLDSVQVFTVYTFQPTRQKLNHETLSLLSLGYYPKEIFKYLPTFFSLCEYSDYIQRVKHTNISRTNQKRISYLGIFRPVLGKLVPKNQSCLFMLEFRA